MKANGRPSKQQRSHYNTVYKIYLASENNRKISQKSEHCFKAPADVTTFCFIQLAVCNELQPCVGPHYDLTYDV